MKNSWYGMHLNLTGFVVLPRSACVQYIRCRHVPGIVVIFNGGAAVSANDLHPVDFCTALSPHRQHNPILTPLSHYIPFRFCCSFRLGCIEEYEYEQPLA